MRPQRPASVGENLPSLSGNSSGLLPRSLLQDFAWGVGGRLRMLVREFLNAPKNCIYLGFSSADKGVLVSKCFFQLFLAHGQALIGSKALQQVLVAAVFAHVQRYCDSVFLDDLVCGFAANACAHRSHEDAGGGQEWQVALEFAVDHRWECAELIQHGKEGYKLAIDGEESGLQRQAANHVAEYVAFVPLLTSKVCNHSQVAAQDNLEATDALAGAGVHLVWHRGRANLAFLETFGDGFVASHQADGGCQRRWRGTQLNQRGNRIKIKGARVDLANGVEHAGKAQVVRDGGFQSCELVFIAAHQIQHVLGSAHWALDAAQWVAAQEVFYALDGQQHFITCRCKTLTQGGRLRRNVVGTARHDQSLVLCGVLANARCNRDG